MGRLVVLSGAGISADSGIDTFRSGPDSIWAQYDANVVCNIDNWVQNYDLVHEFYSKRRCALGVAEPNAAHRLVVSWQQRYGAEIVTQNVDDLFERAGARDLLHVHGFITSLRCPACHAAWDIGYTAFDPATGHCPACQSRRVKPNVVFFGEDAPNYERMWRIFNTLTRDDLLVVIGTSGSVLPVDDIAVMSPARSVLSNLESASSPNDFAFTHVLHGRASAIAPQLDELVTRLMD